MKIVSVNLCKRLGRLFLICPLVLIACSHLREQAAETPAGWDARQAKYRQIDSWYVQGRLGVQTEHQGGSLDLFWNQQGDRYQIRLVAPMGQGAFFITGDSHAVTLRNAQGEIRTSDSADALFSESLGISLPFKNLQYWLRGLSAETDKDLKWDEQGNLYLLDHRGWRVEMARYSQQAGFSLPHAFYLSRADRPELSVRLLLGTWKLSDLPVLETPP